MRISLAPSTVLCGEKGKYTVKNFICRSTRSTTVLCETSRGQLCRLKLYDGQHSVTSALQKRAAAAAVKGALLPFDIGVYGGCPFSVFHSIAATDTAKYPISQELLVQRIIPWLGQLLQQYHQNGILLRDLCPEHILYRVQDQQMAYFGFSNPAVLPKGVTITKAAGYGQHPSFVAPEVPKYGYSTCSDYYALGVTVLALALGYNPLQAVPWQEICANLCSGKIAGVDIGHLRNVPYEAYSEADRVMYLVLGLMLPNPRERWGYQELQCWCNRQHIPLVRKQGKIRYQYTEPFVANAEKCWNNRQLTQSLAADPNAWTEAVFGRLDQFANRQRIAGWQQIAAAARTQSLTASGKIFRCIYGLNPALDGLWWEGKKYADTAALVRGAMQDIRARKTLSCMLRNRALSFFLQMRRRISAVDQEQIREIEQVEQWEIAEPGKGFNRCVMLFSGSVQSRRFRVGISEYRSLDQLLRTYEADGLRLKADSARILKSESFRAWLWACGMEQAEARAQEIICTHPEQAFYLLLKIAESLSGSQEEKRRARRLYLTYGDYAPVFWLTRNIGMYRIVSRSDRVLYDVFRQGDFSLDQTLELLSAQARRMIPDYQSFVGRTAADAAEVLQADLEFAAFSFCPAGQDFFFCHTWDNGLEVCRAFLKEIGQVN